MSLLRVPRGTASKDFGRKDESVKAEWQAVVAASNRPEETDDLTTFRKKKEKKLADARR